MWGLIEMAKKILEQVLTGEYGEWSSSRPGNMDWSPWKETDARWRSEQIARFKRRLQLLAEEVNDPLFTALIERLLAVEA
jgi:hypothetical protein